MVVLVIKHPSTFAAYIIALSLFLYYEKSSSFFRIIIIENPNFVFSSNFDTTPWCGINTITDIQFYKKEFIVNLILKGLLGNGNFRTFALGSICSIYNYESFNMDMPIMSQAEILEVSIAQKNLIGVIYHPNIIVESIRSYFFKSNKVSLFSLRQTTNQEFFEYDLMNKYSDNIIMYDFSSNNSGYSNRDFNITINSNLSRIVLRNDIVSGFPQYILWIPKFKAMKSNTDTRHVRHRITKVNPRFFKIEIIPSVNYKMDSGILSQVDLLQVLQYSDLAIHTAEGLFYSYNLNTFTNKL